MLARFLVTHIPGAWSRSPNDVLAYKCGWALNNAQDSHRNSFPFFS